jgi:hypothetical protein
VWVVPSSITVSLAGFHANFNSESHYLKLNSWLTGMEARFETTGAGFYLPFLQMTPGVNQYTSGTTYALYRCVLDLGLFFNYVAWIDPTLSGPNVWVGSLYFEAWISVLTHECWTYIYAAVTGSVGTGSPATWLIYETNEADTVFSGAPTTINRTEPNGAPGSGEPGFGGVTQTVVCQAI